QTAGRLVVAAVHDDVGTGVLDLGDGRRVVGALRVDGVAGRDGRAERGPDDVGQTLAVGRRVIDHRDLGRLEGVLDVRGDAGALHVVVGEDAVEGLPAVRRQRRVRGRRGDGGEASRRERRAGVLRLAREGRTDDADDVLLVDELLGQGRGLSRVTLRVLGLELDLAVGVLGV